MIMMFKSDHYAQLLLSKFKYSEKKIQIIHCYQLGTELALYMIEFITLIS